MGRIAKWLAAAALLLAGLPGQAQEKNPFSTEGWWKPAEPPFSPAVHDDASITFRLRAPRAHEVTLLLGEWEVSEIPMQRNGNGVWSVTVGPLEPCVYQYIFRIDGFETIDPENPAVKAGTTVYGSVVEIPGAENRRFDEAYRPGGEIHTLNYRSTPLGRMRTLRVYVPEAAVRHPRQKFPVLYLRHGGGDNENSWVTDGRAATILDNLIAENKAVPMYVVMTNGLTDGSWAGGSTPEGIATLEKELLEDVKEARAHGDLSENFEYHAAKKEKNKNESRIRYLERMIKTAKIVSDESKEDEVGLNNTVHLYFEEDDEVEVFKLVTTVRGNSLKGLISTESPIGKAILGKKAGDRVFIRVSGDAGYYVVIKEIENTVDDGSDQLRSY